MDRQIANVLSRDVPEPLIGALRDRLIGIYSTTFENIARPPGGFVPHRTSEIDRFDLAAARHLRRENGMRVLLEVCSEFKIPYQIKNLRCNGQKIVVAQMGQVLMLAEPVDFLKARPEHSKYKADLAASHFAIRQLEMDLGDGYRQRVDSRNTMLVVMQHGMRSGSFTRRDTSLAMMRLAVPDFSFDSWLWYANALNDDLALALDWRDMKSAARPVQEDRVTITMKHNIVQKDQEV